MLTLTFLQTAWTYVKKYWQICLLIVGVVASIFFFRRQDSGFADRLKEIQDAHDEELRKINDARAEEERQHALNEKRLQDALSAIQAQYAAEQKELDDKKKTEVIELVKQYGDNPEELTKRLADATGFTIILPS